MALEFSTRKIVKAKDLNTNGTLHGGRLLHWIDEEAGIYCAHMMDTHLLITRSMGNAKFKASSKFRDVIEFGMEVIKIGRTNLTVNCQVRDLYTKAIIAEVKDIVCVCTNEEGKPVRHALAAYVGYVPEQGAELLKAVKEKMVEAEADEVADKKPMHISSLPQDGIVESFPIDRAEDSQALKNLIARSGKGFAKG